MGLLSPWFLAGLLAAGLPVWLHLLRRHKTVPKPFPSLMFMENRTQTSVKHRRLRYLMLLALRLLMLLLLVLLFVQPFWRTANPPVEGKLQVVAVDRSFSMRSGGALERAKQEARSFLGSKGPGQSAQVIALGSTVETLVQPTVEREALTTAVGAIPEGDGRAGFADLAGFLRTLAGSAKAPLEVHLFSDLQKSAKIGNIADLQLPPGTTLEAHAVGKAKPSNWTVESVRAPGILTDPKRARLEVTLSGFGTNKATKDVTLSVNGRALETKKAEIPENGRARVEFTSLDGSFGLNRGEVRINGGDDLPNDDVFRFAFERVEARKVLFAHDTRQSRAITFLRAAIDAVGDAPFVLETTNCEVAGGTDPSRYAFVILGDCGAIPQFESALKTWVQQGGSVFVTLGAASAQSPKSPVAGLALGGSRYAGREGERFFAVGSVDAGHPVSRAQDAFEGVRFFQVVKLDPGASRVIAKLGDGSPVLTETPVGGGTVLTFASTIDNLANDMPIKPLFVPFIERTASYLGKTSDRQSSFLVGAGIELRTANETGAAEVLDPDGKSVLSLAEASKAKAFTLEREGYYEIRRPGARPELVAVNADRLESDLLPMPPDELDAWKNTGKGDAIAGTTAQAREQQNYSPWRILLVLLLVAGLAESILANRYLSEPKDEERAIIGAVSKEAV